jgi:hypothetical protein
MADPGMYRTPALQGWQRTNVVAAAKCLREQISRTPEDQQLRSAYVGLLDLLDPSRLLARKQREMAQSARQAATQEERRVQERRAAERRRVNLGASSGGERRSGERRARARRSR